MNWITFINQKGERVTLQIANYKKWKSKVNRMKHSKTVTYIGSGSSGY